ncbi:class I SAM-dependent methyltransferase [Nitrosopumilus sp.]|nr:class I SAM-dependent methyltransferase [Nitrosopumilus sp.]
MLKKNKQLSDFYNKVYKKGEKRHYTKYIIQGTPTSETEQILKQISWKNKKVLEVGCGTGLFASSAAKKGSHVLGIDFSERAINIAKKTHKIKNLEFQSMNVKDIEGKFDVIVSIGTLEHMDDPYSILKLFKKHLTSNGQIIITSPNWSNPRGNILLTLFHLFNSPITLADLHYFTPLNFQEWSKKLNMNLKWKTFDHSWAHGDLLVEDFKRRIPKVLSDSKLPKNKKNLDNFFQWVETTVIKLDNSLPHSGALGLYIFKN